LSAIGVSAFEGSDPMHNLIDQNNGDESIGARRGMHDWLLICSWNHLRVDRGLEVESALNRADAQT
jgi:hypothetical protein